MRLFTLTLQKNHSTFLLKLKAASCRSNNELMHWLVTMKKIIFDENTMKNAIHFLIIQAKMFCMKGPRKDIHVHYSSFVVRTYPLKQ